jgi:3-oxoacyl-[acyl-carrier protein] reductase
MAVELRDLTGQIVAITGATSGIGRELARQLVEAGAKVALAARRVDRLDALVEELGAQNALAVPTDVTKPEDCRVLVAATVERWGRLDTMVANAGIGMYGGIMDGTDEELFHMVDVNALGTIWAVRAAVPAMRANNGGDIIIVSSVAGIRSGADEAVYASTKFAQLGLADGIDKELRPDGIRVTAICPAGIKTEFAIGAGRTEGDPLLDTYMMPEDIAFEIVTTLRQPRRLRTNRWTSWSMAQGS